MSRVRQHASRSSALCGVLVVLAATLAPAPAARAGCNLLPVAAVEIPSTGLAPAGFENAGARVTTYLDRPVVGPGQTVTMRVNAACKAGVTRFAATASDNVVRLRFHSPNGPVTETLVPPASVRVLPDSCGTLGCDVLQFDVPATTSFAQGGLTGPAEILVTRTIAPSPTPRVVARVFELYQPAFSCFDPAQPNGGWELDTVFGKLTVLPRQNPLPSGTESSPGVLLDVFGAVDGLGNLLVPIDWRLILGGVGIPAGSDNAVVTQILTLNATAVVALDDDGETDDLRSFNTFGRPIPPLLKLVKDPTKNPSTDFDAVKIVGSTDVVESVLQVGPLVGFDYASRMALAADASGNRIGAVLLLGLNTIVQSAGPLDSLRSSLLAVAVGADEARLGDRDADGDASHLVVEITDIVAGAATNTGQGLTVASASPRRPTLVTSDELVAFLENEALPAPSDRNADLDRFDQIVRVYSVPNDGLPATELTDPPLVSASPASRVNNRPFAITTACTDPPACTSEVDFVFFRSEETGDALRTTERVSRSDATEASQGNAASEGPSLSGDGRRVAFESEATNLVPESVSGRQILLFDRDTGDAVLVSAAADGVSGANADAIGASLSADGEFVAFESEATNLLIATPPPTPTPTATPFPTPTAIP